MSNYDLIVTEDFDDPEELLAVLDPRSDRWENTSGMSRNGWVFRGHGDDVFTLIPSALRDPRNPRDDWGHPFRHILDHEPVQYWDPDCQMSAEFLMGVDFAVLADRQGLPIPNIEGLYDAASLFDELHSVESVCSQLADDSSEWVFPLPKWQQAFAMAQHYGVPTRLLDWTESPLVAAYFAASSGFSLNNMDALKSELLTVWCLNAEALRSGYEELEYPARERIHFVRTPWAPNPNLRAQSGVFTLYHSAVQGVEDKTGFDVLDVEPLERTVEKMGRAWESKDIRSSPPGPLLYRLRLHISECFVLLEALDDLGIHAGSQFPGYSGVADYVKSGTYRPMRRDLISFIIGGKWDKLANK